MKLLKSDKEKISIEMGQKDFDVIMSMMEYTSDQYHALDPALFDDYTKEELEAVSDKIMSIVDILIKSKENEK